MQIVALMLACVTLGLVAPGKSDAAGVAMDGTAPWASATRDRSSRKKSMANSERRTRASDVPPPDEMPISVAPSATRRTFTTQPTACLPCSVHNCTAAGIRIADSRWAKNSLHADDHK